MPIIELSSITSQKVFEPLVATYAITSGELVKETPVKVAKFRYVLFEINNGFDDALTKAAPLVKQLVKTEDGIAPASPEIIRMFDENSNLTRIELRHPAYSPYKSGAPLMFIQVQNLDEEIAEIVERTVVIPPTSQEIQTVDHATE